MKFNLHFKNGCIFTNDYLKCSDETVIDASELCSSKRWPKQEKYATVTTLHLLHIYRADFVRILFDKLMRKEAGTKEVLIPILNAFFSLT